MPTVLKYWLLQLPATACVAFALWWMQGAGWLSPPWPVILLLAWVAKDAAFYPLTRDAYHPTPARHGPQPGQSARVRKPLAPHGKVSINGTLWSARLEPTNERAEVGESVRVVEGEGLVLIVERDRTTAPS